MLCTPDRLLSSQQPEEASGTMSVTLQARKLKHDGVKSPAQDQAAGDTEASIQTQSTWLGVPVLQHEVWLSHEGHS